MMYVILRTADKMVIGPFDTEEDAYVWADYEWGSLNADEFYVLICNDPDAKQLRISDSHL